MEMGCARIARKFKHEPKARNARRYGTMCIHYDGCYNRVDMSVTGSVFPAKSCYY